MEDFNDFIVSLNDKNNVEHNMGAMKIVIPHYIREKLTSNTIRDDFPVTPMELTLSIITTGLYEASQSVGNATTWGKMKKGDIRLDQPTFWQDVVTSGSTFQYGMQVEGSLMPGENGMLSFNQLKHNQLLLAMNQDEASGITTPWLYLGTPATFFPIHVEDYRLLSFSYLHDGAPKIWYTVNRKYNTEVRNLLKEQYKKTNSNHSCPDVLLHKNILPDPRYLLSKGIPVHVIVQRPGDMVVTFPDGLHWGYNSGNNIAEAINYYIPEIFDDVRKYQICRKTTKEEALPTLNLKKLKPISFFNGNTGNEEQSSLHIPEPSSNLEFAKKKRSASAGLAKNSDDKKSKFDKEKKETRIEEKEQEKFYSNDNTNSQFEREVEISTNEQAEEEQKSLEVFVPLNVNPEVTIEADKAKEINQLTSVKDLNVLSDGNIIQNDIEGLLFRRAFNKSYFYNVVFLLPTLRSSCIFFSKATLIGPENKEADFPEYVGPPKLPTFNFSENGVSENIHLTETAENNLCNIINLDKLSYLYKVEQITGHVQLKQIFSTMEHAHFHGVEVTISYEIDKNPQKFSIMKSTGIAYLQFILDLDDWKILQIFNRIPSIIENEERFIVDSYGVKKSS